VKPEVAATARAAGGPLAPRRRQLWAVLALVAVLAIVLATAYTIQQREVVEREALARVSLYARVLEEQTTRSFSSAAQMLRSLSARGTVRRAKTDADAADRLLDQQLPGQPYLRSVAILDETGRVLASTNGADTGHRVDLAALGRDAADPDGQSIGPVLPIRHLADLGAAGGASVSTALPLLRRVPMEGDLPAHWLVALINPDHLATQHALIAAGSSVQVLMSDLRGQVISGAGDAASTVRGIEALPPFTRFLPHREHGEYLGAGSDGAEAVAAFRVSRQWPLLILAEERQHEVMAVWRARAGGAASIAIGVVALLIALGWAIDRSLRREQAALERTHRLNRELAETEQRWKLALDGAGHVVWDMDLGNGEITVSPRVSELLGYGADDLRWTVERLRASTHPADLERTTRLIESHVRGDLQHYEDELRLRTRSGDWKWVLSRAATVGSNGSDSRRPRLIGTMTDIDTRKAAETALRESEARQQAILNSALDGIVIVDQQGQVLQFNPAAEAMFGRRQADAAGQPMHELIVPPHHRQAHQDGMARYRATGHGPVLNRRIEIEAMRSDGTLFPIELTIVPVKSEAGEIFTATVRDISERLKVEAALRDSEARARATFDQAAVGVLQQGVDRRFLRVNQALCDLLGYTQGEFLALDADRLIHPEDVAEGLTGMRRLFAGEIGSYAQEKRYRHKDGHYVWVRVTFSIARDGQAQPLYMIGIVEDIGARRLAQQDLALARARELRIGSRIQRSLLLAEAPRQMPGLWLSSFSQASQDIDGDFVEIIQPGEGLLDLIAGDVMGKGVNAALMGAAVKMQFSRSLVELMTSRSRTPGLPRPAEILAAVDRVMTPHLQALEAFVTLCYLRIDLWAGTLTWVGCGHEEALLVRTDGQIEVLHNQQPPLGVLSAAEFTQQVLPIRQGDALLLHSDGLSDALVAGGERLGHDRVRALFGRLARAHSTPAAVLHLLRRELLAHATVHDDLTLLVARLGDGETPAQRIELKSRALSIAELRAFVEAAAAATPLGTVESGLFTVAVVEAFTNIVRHATGGLPDAPVEVLARSTAGGLSVELVYVGDAFQPGGEFGDTQFDAYPEGGFGLRIMSGACDEVVHLHDAGVNTIRLSKRPG
jgi:PAS domain S-box-containing protein